jgi:RNA:NAD 2'-phosphotransferase (TPT1/KptA family)
MARTVNLDDYIEFLLRYPRFAGIVSGNSGWVDVKTLIKYIGSRYETFNEQCLEIVVDCSNEFEFDVTGTKIRKVYNILTV